MTSPTPREIVKRHAETVKAGAAPVRTSAPAGADDPWKEPIDLAAAIAAPPPFPLGVFPEWLQEFLLSVARGVNAPVDYAASFALGVAAGAIGATLRVQITPSWYERACVYLCVVAEKSAGKTPSFLAVCNPLRKIQARLLKEHADDEDEPPVLYATDTTVEAIAPRLKANPRGMVVTCDELSGWVGSFNQYKSGGKGSDRQFWLSNWSGGDHSVLRRNPDAPHIYVPHPCVSVVGGVQPPVLRELAQGRDDGLLERLLLSAPVPRHEPDLTRHGYANADEWARAVELLVARRMEEGDYGKRPKRLSITDDAWEVFRSWYAVPPSEERLAGAKSKLNGYAARLALVLHALRYLAQAGDMFPITVEAETMADGVSLAKYFLAHAECVYGTHRQSPAVKEAELVLAWIRRSGGAPFTRRDAFRAMVRTFPAIAGLNEPLRLLVDHGYLRMVPGNRSDRWAYTVHPSLVTKPADAKESKTAEKQGKTA